MRRTDRRDVLFDLGDFVVEPEVASLLSYAQVRGLIERHARGDWGSVSASRARDNQAFVHPKNRSRRSSAESLHVVQNASICLLTRQDGPRRTTYVFLL